MRQIAGGNEDKIWEILEASDSESIFTMYSTYEIK